MEVQAQQEANLADIFVSPLNPRKTYNKEKEAELLADVKIRGVHTPVLVRQAQKGPKPIELIFGSRRLKAATAAALKTIPIRFVTMTDQEVIEAAISENAQRDDIHPLEEAEAYELLHNPPKDATYKALTAEEIGARFGKSRASVFNSLKLLELTKENRKRFYDGAIDKSRALLLARIPAELQDKAGKEIADDKEGTWSFRDAQHHVVNNYMLRLADASFDIKDAQLVAKAGACDKCPKRTGNQRELFSDVTSPDVCTDPVCYRAKKNAHADKLLAAAKEKKQTVLPAAEAKKVFYSEGTGGGLRWDAGYEKASKETPADKVVLAKVGGEVHRLVKKAKPAAAREFSYGKPRKATPAELIAIRVEARTRDELATKIATKPTLELWRAIAIACGQAAGWRSDEIDRRLIGADNLKPRRSNHRNPATSVGGLAKKMKTVGELQALVVGFCVDRMGAFENVKPLMKAAGVDVEAHVARATAEIKPGKKPAKEAAPAEKKKPAKKAKK